MFADSSSQVFVDLKESQHARKLVHHVQQIAPGSDGELSTQIDQKKLDLSLKVSPATDGLYEVEVDASLQQELLDPAKPISQVKIPVMHFATAIKLSDRKSFAASGITSRDSETTQVVVVSLVEPWAKQDSSPSR